jgi:hypothetical protein
MRTALTALAIFVIAGTFATASSGERQDRVARDKAVREFCKENDTRDCQDYRFNSARWTDSRFKAFYRRNLSANTDPEIARVFDVELNAQAASNEDKYLSHAERCATRYPSYDTKSDTYKDSAGKERPCNL